MSARETLAAMYRDNRVLIFGHRGASAYAPMNTIPAFELAVKQGADAVELDVHLTKDGAVVVFHDFTVEETSNGEGEVAAMTLEEIKSLDAGSWFSPEFCGTEIPTLDEVFEAVGKKVFVNVEIKTESAKRDGTEEAVADCIKRHDMQNRVIISAFNAKVLKHFRPLMPDVPLGYLLSLEEMAGSTQVVVNPHNYDAYHISYDMLSDSQLSWAKEHGHLVNIWTVNDPARARQLALKGVHGIISDKPDVIKQALA
jgi:glycerophosphoryl diester phosphodiesterase